VPNLSRSGQRGSRLFARGIPYLLVAPVAISLIVLMLGPMLIQLYYSFLGREQGVYAYHIVHQFTPANYQQIFTQKDILGSLGWTLASSLVVAVGTIIVGLPISQYLARGTGRGKVFVEMALLLPLFGDIFMAYALLYAFAPQGIVNWALVGSGLIKEPLYLNGTPAMAIGMMMLPSLAVLLMRSALSGVDPVYEQAALMLGANPFRAWFGTTFALARTGIVGAFLLVFAGAVGAYTIPAILAGVSNDWFSTLMDKTNQFDNIPLASAMGVVVTLLTAAVIYLNLRVSRPRYLEQT
jgi:ABC-type spermidine/putrescine transport system permease subunit I